MFLLDKAGRLYKKEIRDWRAKSLQRAEIDLIAYAPLHFAEAPHPPDETRLI
jgi:hypothetical protein